MARVRKATSEVTDVATTDANGPQETSDPVRTEGPVEIKITDEPFLVGDRRIASLRMPQMSFVKFVASMEAAEFAMLRDGASGKTMLKYVARERLRMLTAISDKGETVKLDDTAIMMMPRRYALRAMSAAAFDEEEPGEVVVDGNGIDIPVLFRLGVPLKMMSKTGDLEIREIEFRARTFGDIEDVIGERTTYAQALALLRRCAKPVGSPIPLQSLPDWAIDQISVADGLKIAEGVLQSFLD